MRRQIPLKWFALLLVLWVVSYVATFVSTTQHITKMDEYIAQRKELAIRYGDMLLARIERLEENCDCRKVD